MSAYPTRRRPIRAEPLDDDDRRGRVIPFERRRPAVDHADYDYARPPRPLRTSADGWGAEPRASAADRRARRRRPRSWMRRHAISVLGVGFLFVLLGFGFGLMQLVARGDHGAAPTATPAPTAIVAAAPGASDAPADAADPAAAVVAGPREIQASAQALDPNYTVQSGDTLNAIAAQFNTSVARIAALNSLADPKALKIGQKLVIPPAL
ncbi:MAG: LysM peptidoglycan-binding domain-containing protein [Chloroflexi bacterium]|nr:LysM peptidoglycan-binding domain-containing protein [Chloroflexota bacterium]